MNKNKPNLELIKFRKSLGLSQVAFAEALGCPQPLITMVEKGNRTAPQSLKDALLAVYNYTYIKPIKEVEKVIPSTIVPIPFHDIGAAAGAGTWLADEPEQNVIYFDKRFLKQVLKSENFAPLHIIYAKGDSMDSGWNQPDDIKDGDLLMVDTSQTTGNNQIFVIMVNNSELRVKKLFKRGEALYISSNNSKYKEEVYYPDNTDFEVKVIGRVVWNGSKENI